MRKYFFVFLTLFLTIGHVKADYSGTYGDNISWVLTTADSTLTIWGEGKMPSAAYVADVPWYTHRHKIAQLIIQSGITGLGDYMCCNYSNLRSAVIPEGVTSIGHDAFCQCSKLTNCTYPSTLDSIDYMAFTATAITSIDLPMQMHYIGNAAFEGCTGITQINIPINLQTINNRSFSGLRITTLYIPDNITTIEYGAFSRNPNLILVEFGTGTKTIANSAFDACPEIKSTHYRGTLEDWLHISFQGDYAHPGQNVYINGNLLSDVTIPASITSIPRYAFSRTNIKSVVLHDNVTSIEACAFSECDSLTDVVFSNSLHTIEGSAFYNCTKLTTLTFPASLSTIGNSSFSNCKGLTSINFAEGLTTLDMNAFNSCENLQNLVLPNSTSTIGDYAFSYCYNLTYVQMGSGMTSIGKRAFYRDYNIQIVYIDALIPPTLGQNAFDFKVYNGNQQGISYPLSVPCNHNPVYYLSAWGTTFANINEHYVEGNLEVYSYDEEQGSVEIVSQPSDCINNTAVISATPLDGYQFEKWDDDNTDNPRQIVVTGDYQYYIALFKPIVKVHIDVFADPAEGQAEGSGEYAVGDTITITAIPNEGYDFSHWDDGNTDNPRQVTVTETKSYVAFFTPQADALEDVLMQQTPNGKFIIDGELYIIKDGKLYSPLGTEIKTIQR